MNLIPERDFDINEVAVDNLEAPLVQGAVRMFTTPQHSPQTPRAPAAAAPHLSAITQWRYYPAYAETPCDRPAAAD